MSAVESKRVRVVNRKLVPVGRLKFAAHNPPKRTDPKNLKELMDSMDMIGLLHPVTISPDETVIDGHRRTAAARLLGWEDIECSVVEEDQSTVYASVNPTARRFSGNDVLSIWLANPSAVPTNTASRIKAMTDVIGKPLVRRIAEDGFSMRVYQTAQRLCRYCEDTEPETVKRVVNWLLDTATIGLVMKAMEAGQSPKTIMEAVRKGKPIVFRVAVGE